MSIKGGSGGGASAGAIRAGRAFVELALKDNALIRGLDGLKNRLQKTAQFVAGIGAAGVGVGASLLAPLGAALGSVVDRGNEVQKLADRLGATTEEITRLSYAAESVGVNFEQFGDTAKDLQKNLAEAAYGGGPAEAFAMLGLNATKLMEMPITEQLNAISDALAGVDQERRVNLAEKILGGNGAKLVGLLGQGSQALRELGNESDRVGTTISGEQAKSAAAAWGQFQKVLATIRGTIFQVGSALLPSAETLRSFDSVFTTIAGSVRQFIDENKSLIQTVAAVGAGLVVGGGAFLAIGGILAAGSVAVGGFVSALSGLAAVLGFAVTPLGALITGLGVLATQTETGRQIFTDFKTYVSDAFSSIGESASSTIGGVVSAMKSGDIALAGKVAFAGLNAIVTESLGSLSGIWQGWRQDFFTGWTVILNELKRRFNKFTTDFAAGILVIQSELPEFLGGITIDEGRQRFEGLRKDQDALDKQFDGELEKRILEANAAVANAKDKAASDLAKAKKELADAVDEAAKAELKRRESVKKLAADVSRGTQASILRSSQAVFDSRSFSAIFSRGQSVQERQLAEDKKHTKALEQIASALAGGIGTLVYAE